MQLLKKYFSLLFLFLFLFPQVEIQVHAFEHKDDLHCTATDKHFHNSEHNCSICDFTTTDSSLSADNSHSVLITVSEFNYLPFTESADVSFAHYHLPSRAPPTA